jgi:hypothetical protein
MTYMIETHMLSADVIVVGGGLSGVASAIAAARLGARTILVHDRPMLGGNTSSEIRVHAGGADRSGARPHCRESGIMDEIRLEEAARNPQRCAQMWDLILYEKCLQEPHLSLYLNTTCVAAHVRPAEADSQTSVDEPLPSVERAAAAVLSNPQSQIEHIEATRESTEDRFIIRGRFFVDCTGDGRLSVQSGVQWCHGREGPDEYGEPHAQGPDNKTMGASLMWVAEDVGVPVPFTPPGFARKFTDDDLPHRKHIDLDHGYWWIEYGGELDTVKDKEAIRDELMACLMGVWDHVKNGGRHGADNWVLKWFGWLPGHRESRRIIGDLVLTENDLMSSVLFDDRVAHGGWPMDTHPPGGIYSSEPPATFLQMPDIYSIPLRALYSRDVGNLFMAGRCASCTHMAMSSTRLAATGAVMGQAVGTAAAMCCARDCTPRELVQHHIRDLQQQLLRDDQYIIDLPAEDPDDLTRGASVAASSESVGCESHKLLDGVTRMRHGDTHQWASDPQQAMPQWLEIKLPSVREVSQIHLTFDSGFSRPLALTHQDSFNARMFRGPQPETVSDYVIELGSSGTLTELVRETGNYQRKRVHHIAPVAADTIRITIHRTNGDPSARMYEVRMYA